MIVLIVTPEEGGTIRDLLPAGALKDYVTGQVAVELIPAPIPELVIWRPNWTAEGTANGQSLHVFNTEQAAAMQAAALAAYRVVSRTKDLPPDMAKVLNEHLWSLYD